MPDPLVVDASAMIELLLGTSRAEAVADRLRGHALHAPALLEAEILSAMGRLERAGELDAATIGDRIERLRDAPLERHSLETLMEGAWGRRHDLRLVDALYVELADRLGAALITVDRGLARAVPAADLID